MGQVLARVLGRWRVWAHSWLVNLPSTHTPSLYGFPFHMSAQTSSKKISNTTTKQIFSSRERLVGLLHVADVTLLTLLWRQPITHAHLRLKWVWLLFLATCSRPPRIVTHYPRPRHQQWCDLAECVATFLLSLQGRRAVNSVIYMNVHMYKM